MERDEQDSENSHNKLEAPIVEIETSIWPEQELQRAADRIVLARFGPAGLIIDEGMNVLQSRGQISQFIELTPGVVNWNVLRLLKYELVNEVRVAAQRAIHENVPTSAQAVLIDEQSGEQYIHIDVLPISGAASCPRAFLILFQPLAKGQERKLLEQVPSRQLTPDGNDRLIAQLRQDLSSTRFQLRELQTVNDELQQRNNVLTQAGNALSNLLNSVNIPLLILNSDLQIRQFTAPMRCLLSVRPSDIGRAIREIRLQLSLEDLEPILNEVLESLRTREMEVQDKEGHWHLLRVCPYRTADNKIEGLVVLLLDIDQLRQGQQQLVDARDFARSVVESAPVAMVVLNEDCTVRIANKAFRDLTQMPTTDIEGHSLPDVAALLWGINGLREKLKDLLQSPPGSRLEFEHEFSASHRKTLLIKAQALPTEGSRALLLIEDISFRREAERLIAKEKEALVSEIAIAARKLNRTQEELRGLTAHLFTVQEEERQRVARELHDDIGQRLSLLEMELQEMHRMESTTIVREKVEGVRDQVHALNSEVRTLSHRLHPAILNDLGLPVALKGLVTEFGQREEMPANFSTHDLPESCPPEASITLYRIAQEALRNVAKHAGKTHVKVSLIGKSSSLLLKVTDFGVGFDRDAEIPNRGLGMISMQERARLAGGMLDVQSELGQGTTISVEIPLEQNA